MARNGAGVYSLPVGSVVSPNTTISSTVENALTSDLATELTDSLSRSGKGGMLADLAMGGKKITGLGTPTANTDAATKAYVDTGVASRPNIMRANGGLEIWQRGAGSSASIAVGASTTAYTADRWYLTTGANQASTVFASNGLTNGSQLCAGVQRNSGQTGTTKMIFGYPLDTDEVAACRGSLILLSFTVSAGSNWSPTSGTLNYDVYFGTGAVAKRGAGFASESHPLTGSVNLAAPTVGQRVTFVGAGTVGGATITQGEVQFTWTPTGTAGAVDFWGIDDVQLETVSGSTSGASPFQRLKFEEQLAMCRRHYWKTFGYGTAPASNLGTVDGNGLFFSQTVAAPATQMDGIAVRFPVPMRAVPGTFTSYNPGAANAQIRNVSRGTDFSVTAINLMVAPTTEGCVLSATSGGSSAAGDRCMVHLTFDASI